MKRGEEKEHTKIISIQKKMLFVHRSTKMQKFYIRTVAHRSFCSCFDMPIILFRPVSLGFMAIYRCLCLDYMLLMFIRPRKIYHIIRQAKKKKKRKRKIFEGARGVNIISCGI